MGLAVQTIRPRNRGYHAQMFNDGASVADNGFLLATTAITFRGTEVSAVWSFPYDIVIEELWVKIVSNNLAVASTNTITLRDDLIDTAKIITLTDTSSVVNALTAAGGDIAIAAHSLISVMWESDSATTCTIRGWGYSFRRVIGN